MVVYLKSTGHAACSVRVPQPPANSTSLRDHGHCNAKVHDKHARADKHWGNTHKQLAACSDEFGNSADHGLPSTDLGRECFAVPIGPAAKLQLLDDRNNHSQNVLVEYQRRSETEWDERSQHEHADNDEHDAVE